MHQKKVQENMGNPSILRKFCCLLHTDWLKNTETWDFSVSSGHYFNLTYLNMDEFLSDRIQFLSDQFLSMNF